MYPSRPAIAAALLGAVAMFAGCQSYRSKPLDLAAHRDAWRARTPGDEPVRAFAERLAEFGEPVAFDLSDGLSLAEGEVVALVFNPDLRLARLRAGIATATAEHAGLWEDPQFSIDVVHITESVSNPWVITPGLAFTIPISGRLGAEKQRADAAMRTELTRVAEQEWQTRIEVRRAWLRWSAVRLRIERTEELLASIESLVSSTMRLADAGEILPTESALFTIERASQRRALLRYRGEAAEAELELRTLLGLSPGAPLSLVPTLRMEPGELPDTDETLADHNLTLARLRDEFEVAERSLLREIRKQYPDLTIGPLYETDQGQSRIGFIGAIPLPILNANKQGIAEARAERELARAAFETAYERLAGSLATAMIRLDTLREQRGVIESDIVPLVDRQFADAQHLLRLGEGGGLVLLESLTRVGQTQMELIDALLGESLAMAELAELAGPPTSPIVEPTDTVNTGAAGPVPAIDEGDGAREVNP